MAHNYGLNTNIVLPALAKHESITLQVAIIDNSYNGITQMWRWHHICVTKA